MISVLYRKLIRDLWGMRAQAFAIGIVMACGVATTVLALGTMRSLEVTLDSYYQQYRFADIFAAVKRAPRGILDRIESIEGVRRAEGRITANVILDMPDLAEPGRGRLVSLPAEAGEGLNDLYLRRGRLPQKDKEFEAVVSEGFAEAHGLELGARVPTILNGRRRSLTVVGVGLSPEFIYSIPPGAFMPDDKRYGIFWMNRTALEAAFDLDGAFNDVILSITKGASEADIIEQVDGILDPYGGLGAYGRDDQISHWFVASELEQLRQYTFIFPVIFMAVAAFLMNATLTRIVSLERPQIGLMKGLGYTREAIALHYLELALLIAAMAVIAGNAAGLWFGRDLTVLYADFFRFPILEYRLSADVIGVSILVGLLAAAIGAAGAVRRVITLAPAEAMRPPSPAVYRRGWLERLGLLNKMRQPSRMIWRHIRRHPVRSLLSCFGISMGVVVLIISLFTLDSMDYIIDSQFDVAQRQDISVSFAEPVERSGYYDFLTLPGVQYAEPMRAVPVRLINGPNERRSSIVGLPDDADLFRMIDAQVRPVDLSDFGLVLSTKLAQLLGARVGDTVTIETLEGRRLTRRIVVSQIVNEFIGTSAYMHLPALNRLMLEGHVISGVQLKADPADQTDLYERLKTMPVVAGVGVNEIAIQNWEETTGEFLNIIVFIYVTFASLIAIGVVYNGARISLSERGLTLATMRVMGFTLGDISYILLGELVILVLVAIPLGWGLGYGLASEITAQLDTELYRIPLIIERSTYGFATVIVILAALGSSFLVWRRLRTIDLVSALKRRE